MAGGLLTPAAANAATVSPGQPTNLQLSGLVCPSSGVLPMGTLTPTFSAVFPSTDPAASLTAVFEWIEVPAAGLGVVTDQSPTRQEAPPDRTYLFPNSWATSAQVQVTANKTYAFRAKGIDARPPELSGPWSAWCQFTADTRSPTVTGRMLTVPAGPEQTGRVRIESPDTDVTTFLYGYGAATTAVAAQGTSPKYAEVDIVAQGEGTNVLQIMAVDAARNAGNGSVEFIVPSS